jgi:hypothetical protein
MRVVFENHNWGKHGLVSNISANIYATGSGSLLWYLETASNFFKHGFFVSLIPYGIRSRLLYAQGGIVTGEITGEEYPLG